MKEIKTENAVGHVLCHDMTQIIPGVTKDARFRKGHVVTGDNAQFFAPDCYFYGIITYSAFLFKCCD